MKQGPYEKVVCTDQLGFFNANGEIVFAFEDEIAELIVILLAAGNDPKLKSRYGQSRFQLVPLGRHFNTAHPSEGSKSKA